MNLKTEKSYYRRGFRLIIGLDEAGRGPLAGPIAAAAVIISPFYNQINKYSKAEQIIWKKLLSEVRDSKKLSEKQREKIFPILTQSSFIKFSYSLVNAKIIDQINIDRATKKAMKNCLKKLLPQLGCQRQILNNEIILLIDGNKIIDPKMTIPQKTIIKSDDKVFSIAAASIIAKVIRDHKMKLLAKKYPQYKFETHKGYPTKLHRQLIHKYGLCKIHRRSYLKQKLN